MIRHIYIVNTVIKERLYIGLIYNNFNNNTVCLLNTSAASRQTSRYTQKDHLSVCLCFHGFIRSFVHSSAGSDRASYDRENN